MDNEDELPKELEKLAISPFWMRNAVCQVNFLNENNKVHVIETEESEEDSDTAARRIFNTASQKVRPLGCRRCRIRRNSESTLDEIKLSKANSSNNSVQCYNQGHNIIGGTLKQVLKGTHGTVRRRIILREPILKALHTCLSPHNRFHKRFMLSDDKSLMFNAIGMDMSTCHSLIVKCRNLLTDDVDFTRRLTHLNLNARNEKKCSRLKALREGKKEICRNSSNMKVQIQNLNVNEENGIDESVATNASTINDTQQQSFVNSAHSFYTNSMDNVCLNTSCSQQASTSSSTNTCDDVTIDELASYFDTFVYIPKKMSSMAEMMYI